MKIEKLARSDFKRLASQLAGFVLKENNRVSVISSDDFVGFGARAEGPRGGCAVRAANQTKST